MLQYEPWYLEAPLLNMPWKEEVAQGKGLPANLSFGILWDDGVVAPHPPIRAALERTKSALLAAGHEVINWKPLDHKLSWDLIVKLYLLDAGQEYKETMEHSGEPAVYMTNWMLAHSEKRESYTVAETFQLNREREAFRAKALAHWNATANYTGVGRPVDAILCPVAPTLAPPHDSTRWWGYTSYWNLLDYPGVVFPSGFLAKEECYLNSKLPIARNSTEEYIHAQWSPETYEGAPISLQLIGRRHEEEKLLAMLDRLEDAVRCHS